MLQQIMIEVGDEDPADKDKHCLGFLQAAFRKPRY
ncbi:BnaA07g02850D [Brassica napus]|uniref:BnaA07g02850D protein n=2 Tax=Brassiceae TaxID=981071 RepID=A0A078GCY8_BRANA|nr:BnaA07g02850D [Brassica napus]